MDDAIEVILEDGDVNALALVPRGGALREHQVLKGVDLWIQAIGAFHRVLTFLYRSARWPTAIGAPTPHSGYPIET